MLLDCLRNAAVQYTKYFDLQALHTFQAALQLVILLGELNKLIFITDQV